MSDFDPEKVAAPDGNGIALSDVRAYDAKETMWISPADQALERARYHVHDPAPNFGPSETLDMKKWRPEPTHAHDLEGGYAAGPEADRPSDYDLTGEGFRRAIDMLRGANDPEKR